MKDSAANERSSRSNQQDAKTKVEEKGFLENELLPFRLHGSRPAGSNHFNNQRSQNNRSCRRKRNNYIEMLPTRRSPHNVQSWGLRFQPGNGDLNRRGPIPELEPLPRRKHLLPPLRQVPQQDVDGTVVSDEEEGDEEEHEYLPNNARHRNNCDRNVHLVSPEYN